MGLEQVQFFLEFGDGFLGDAGLGARAADLRLYFVLLNGGLVLEFFQAQLQLFALDFDPLLVVVALAQRHEVAAQTAQLLQSLGGVTASAEVWRKAAAKRAVRQRAS